MKRFLLSLSIVALLNLDGFAQTEKGRYFLGTDIWASAYNSKNSYSSVTNKYRDFGVSPKLAHFVKDNLAIGFGLNFQTSKNINNYKSNNYGADIFVRKYYDLASNFKFLLNLNLGQDFGNTYEINNGKTGDKTDNFKELSIGLRPGFAFFPTKRFSIELSDTGIEYNRSKNTDLRNDRKTTETELEIIGDTFTPTIGINYYF